MDYVISLTLSGQTHKNEEKNIPKFSFSLGKVSFTKINESKRGLYLSKTLP